MKTESKKFLNIFLVAVISITGSFSYTFADSAFIPGGYWEQLLQNGGLFGNLTRSGGFFGGNTSGASERLIQTNCQYEARDNQFTGQITYDLICDNQTVRYNNNNQPTYTQPTYYSQPVSYYQEPTYYYTQTYTQPTYNYSYYPNNNSLPYYQGSNIWYPQNNYGYSNQSMFATYYSGPEGAGRYDRYYDSPNLCFDGGPNCGGYPQEDDYYHTAQMYGQANGLSANEVDYYYNQGYNAYDPNVSDYYISY